MWDKEFAKEIFGSLVALDGNHFNMCFKGFYNGESYFIKKIKARPSESLCVIQERIERTERINRLFMSNGIKTITAICNDGLCTHKKDEAIWIAFPWVDAKTIEHVDEALCYEIGCLLARMHNIYVVDRYLNTATICKKPDFSWKRLITEQEDKALYPFVNALYDLKQYSDVEKSEIKNQELIVSHGDVHIGNLLKKDDEYILIDWELCGCVNPYAELFDTALNMSGFLDAHTDIRYFESVVKGYFDIRKDVTKQIEVDSVIEDVYLLIIEYMCNYINDYLSNKTNDSIKCAKQLLDQFYELKKYDKQFKKIINQYVIGNVVDKKESYL